MKTRVYLAAFRGQFGWLGSSIGVYRSAYRARNELGIRADVFGYTQLDQAAQQIRFWRSWGYRIALLGYSAGVGSVTSLQQTLKVDLLLGIAGSKFCFNYPIDHTNTKRSVLWRDQDEPTSAAGADLGFDVVHEVNGVTHLTMDLKPDVWNGIQQELKALCYG